MNFGKGRLKNELYNHLLTKIHIYLILLRIKKWAENDDIKLEVDNLKIKLIDVQERLIKGQQYRDGLLNNKHTNGRRNLWHDIFRIYK